MYERHLACSHAIDPRAATARERFEAVALLLRDRLTRRWLQTARAHAGHKRVDYLSMVFLIGRSLTKNVINMMAKPLIHFHRFRARQRHEFPRAHCPTGPKKSPAKRHRNKAA